MKSTLYLVTVLFLAVEIVYTQKICKSFECTTTSTRPTEHDGYCIFEPLPVNDRYTAFVYSGSCSSKYRNKLSGRRMH